MQIDDAGQNLQRGGIQAPSIAGTSRDDGAIRVDVAGGKALFMQQGTSAGDAQTHP
jgi:hypothetical protein